MWLSLYLWACSDWVGCSKYKEIFWYCFNAGYFSVNLEYIFVVIKNPNFFLLYLHTTFYLWITITCFSQEWTCLFLFSLHSRLTFSTPSISTALHRSLMLYECCFSVSVCSTETWKKTTTFRLPTHHFGLSDLIPKASVLFQFLVSCQSPAIILVFVSRSSQAISGEVDKKRDQLSYMHSQEFWSSIIEWGALSTNCLEPPWLRCNLSSLRTWLRLSLLTAAALL